MSIHEVKEDYLDYIPEESRIIFHNSAVRIASTDGRISIGRLVHNYKHGILYLIRLEQKPYGILGRQTSEEELVARRDRDSLEDKDFFTADFQTFDAPKGVPRLQIGNGRGNNERETVHYSGEGRYFRITRLNKKADDLDTDEELE